MLAYYFIIHLRPDARKLRQSNDRKLIKAITPLGKQNRAQANTKKRFA